MDEQPIRVPPPAGSAEPAEWLTSRIAMFGANWVTGTVGTGWPAYARIFHPLDDAVDALRWSDVAATHGHRMHPGAQWEIISTDQPDLPLKSGRGFPGEPELGHLHQRALAALCHILAPHTTTAQRCWFALWEGRGWMHEGAHTMLTAPGPSGDGTAAAPHDWQLELTGPKFALPYRSYHLFGGPLQDATQLGYWVSADCFHPQSPNLMWPNDHAWCLATEIDFDTTLVGGSQDLVADITASPHLEALAISPEAAVGMPG